MVYLSSPYSNPDDAIREQNYKTVSLIAAQMVYNGELAFSPISYGHNLSEFKEMPANNWSFWYNFCIGFLLKSDKLIVVKMNGWDRSVGVAGEIEVAIKNNIPIEYMEPNEFFSANNLEL